MSTRINSTFGRFFALIDYEDYPFNPREEYDHDTVIVYHSQRYALGDVDIAPDDFELPDNVWVFPVYADIHDSIALSISNDFQGIDPGRWDSGQSGIIYVSKDICPDKAQAFRFCEAEIAEFSAYLEGDVWDYTIHRADDPDGEPLDFSWGFYGYDNCKKAAEEMLAECEKEPRWLSLLGMEEEIPLREAV